MLQNKKNKKSMKQKYKMKGCSKTCKNKKTKYLGGTTSIKGAYPSQGPPRNGYNFLNPIASGGCGGQCSSSHNMSGGSKHRMNCRCAMCKQSMKGGNNPMPYPNGLLGNAWTPSISGWPGVDGINMNRNHLGYNTYSPNDVSRQMRDVGPAPPFTYLNGGKMKSKMKNKSKSKTKKQNGGTLSNYLGQDFINLGRQFQYGIGSSYNAIRGYHAPANPLPWKDQLV